MKSIYTTIVELESLRHDKRVIQDRERQIAVPIWTDLDRMGELYSRFLEVRPPGLRLNGRNVFILIATRVFSPKSLAGHNLGAGVRDRMATVLGVKPTVISHAFDNLVFHYKRYRGFRSEVDGVFEELFGEND